MADMDDIRRELRTISRQLKETNELLDRLLDESRAISTVTGQISGDTGDILQAVVRPD